MIDLFIETQDREDPVIYASGLIPGMDIALHLNGKFFRIHRHGNDCHVHTLLEAREETDANESPAQTHRA